MYVLTALVIVLMCNPNGITHSSRFVCFFVLLSLLSILPCLSFIYFLFPVFALSILCSLFILCSGLGFSSPSLHFFCFLSALSALFSLSSSIPFFLCSLTLPFLFFPSYLSSLLHFVHYIHVLRRFIALIVFSLQYVQVQTVLPVTEMPQCVQLVIPLEASL